MDAKASKLNKKQIDHLRALHDTSAQIRFLNSCGLSRGDIVRELEAHTGKKKRYQHIRGILTTPVKTPREKWEL